MMETYNPQLTTYNKDGFTLIELLIVISIIGILATLLMANMAGVRERARDAQRKSEINQAQKALELYKSNQVIPQYPASLSSLVSTYLKSEPHDPRCPEGTCVGDWVDYQYTRDPLDNLLYKIVACLENASDPQRDATKDSYCSNADPDLDLPASYTRTEP